MVFFSFSLYLSTKRLDFSAPRVAMIPGKSFGLTKEWYENFMLQQRCLVTCTYKATDV